MWAHPLSHPCWDWGELEAMRVACLLSLQPPPLAIPLNLPWPPLTKPLHPQSARKHLVARCAPPHPVFLGSNSQIPCSRTDCFLTANKCLFRPLLPDPIPRQRDDWPFSEMTQDRWGVVIPNPRRWQLGLMLKSSFPFLASTRLMKLSYITIGSKNFLDPSDMGCVFVSRPHWPKIPSWMARPLISQDLHFYVWLFLPIDALKINISYPYLLERNHFYISLHIFLLLHFPPFTSEAINKLMSV